MADNNQQEAKGSAYGDFHRRVLEGRAALFAVCLEPEDARCRS